MSAHDDEVLRVRTPMQLGMVHEQVTLHVAFAIACTVYLLNQLGMVHGDLKPDNVLLHEGGWPLVTNDGCATSFASLHATDRKPLGPNESILVRACTRIYMKPLSCAVHLTRKSSYVVRCEAKFGLGV